MPSDERRTCPISVVDAFTDRAFSGNPAAVCQLDEWPADDVWLQAVAAEMNLAETAFLVHRADGDLDLRWFTPTVEIDLCGHATLASVHVLQPDGELRFHTRSGVLVGRSAADAIELDFPVAPGTRVPVDPRVVEALGTTVRVVENGLFLLVEVGEARVVRELTPDIAGLGAVHPHGVIVTARGDQPGVDFVSRVFAPNQGIPEDPVTGSAHCQLAPFWGARLGRTEMSGRQVSSRGGTVGVRLAGDRVVLVGTAVTVLNGTLHC